MLKILSTSQVKELDAFTIAHEPIASIDLMERACRAFCSWFTEQFDETHRIGIVCGTGNNGGDGLGIARMLHEYGYPVRVWIVYGNVRESEDFQINRKRLPSSINVTEIRQTVTGELFGDCHVLIDALFGSGLSRAVEGIYGEVIHAMNQTDAIRVAVDIPSGLMADVPSSGRIVQAHYTVTFQLPRLAFLLAENFQYVGEWHVVDIGLSKKFIEAAECRHFLLTRSGIKKLVKQRTKFDHKGKFGHALLIAGSTGKMGAAVLAATGALRSGAGLLTVHAPKNGYTILQTAVPEAMVSVDDATDFFSNVPVTGKYNVVGIGPGLGMEPQTVQAVDRLLSDFRIPMVIDADALNILATHSFLMHKIPTGSVLTPHPGEFRRLAGDWKNDFERLDRQIEMAARLQSVVIVKGAHTAIAFPDSTLWFNNTGNPGMAKGGSGDALTGILTGLMARGYPATDAARLGCWVHGRAADIAVHEKGRECLITRDLLEKLPEAFRQAGAV
ncbi:MAG: NAD(P)H-hydrate dehydratase [Cyclobacteriaceae bacterium]|nr:NAD(P)H-hydrate dehydratase [Cyclobacteriaceae bacterium]